VWNTSGYDYGNYTIIGVAEQVPGENDVADNTLANGVILLTIPGDVDGDHDVDIFDLVRIVAAYGSSQPDPEYIEACDIDGDGDVDIFDLVITAVRYGESW
jgi:hypothetical protein